MPTTAQMPPPEGAVPVRYYPRRLTRAGRRAHLSPSQALHLADDPARAASARLTDEHREFRPATPASDSPPGLVPAPRVGRLRRWLHTLLRR